MPNRLKVLIIDDDPDASALYSLIWCDLDCVPAVARTIAEAKQKIADWDFNIISVDYRLPDGNGIDALEEMTQDPKLKNTVRFILSNVNYETMIGVSPTLAYEIANGGYFHKTGDVDELTVNFRMIMEYAVNMKIIGKHRFAVRTMGPALA